MNEEFKTKYQYVVIQWWNNGWTRMKLEIAFPTFEEAMEYIKDRKLLGKEIEDLPEVRKIG